ncbi:MAG: hypothetical protein WBV95_14240, partial [Desulfobacterales bacterium]
KIFSRHAHLDRLVKLPLALVFAWEICLSQRSGNEENQCKDDAPVNCFHRYHLIKFFARTGMFSMAA